MHSSHSIFQRHLQIALGFSTKFRRYQMLPIYFPNPAASKNVMWNQGEANRPVGRNWLNQCRHNRGIKSHHLFVFAKKPIAITHRITALSIAEGNDQF